jgi:hypothetical protein
MLNYKDLLQRYMAYVASEEGIDFVDRLCRSKDNDLPFSDDEIKELEKLDRFGMSESHADFSILPQR